MQKILHNFFIYGLFSSISSLLGFFLLPYYSKVFTPSEYAILDLTLTIIYLCSILGILQLESAIGRFYSDVDFYDFKKYVSTSLFSFLGVSLFLTLILAFFSKPLSLQLFNGNNFAIILIIASLIIPLQNVVGFSQVILQFEERVYHFGILILIQTTSLIILTILFVGHFKFGLTGAIISVVVSYLITSLIALFIIRDHIVLEWDINLLKKLLKYSIPLVPVVFISYANAHFGRVIIARYVTLNEVGVLSAAIKICYILKLIQLSFRKIWYPYFFKAIKYKHYRKTLNNFFIRVIVILTIIFILFEIFSANIIQFVLDSSYHHSASMVNILAIYNFLLILYQLFNVGGVATGRTAFNIIPTITGFVINITSLLIFIPYAGIYSAPFSLVISSMSMLVISLIITQKIFPLKYPYWIISFSILIQSAIVFSR